MDRGNTAHVAVVSALIVVCVGVWYYAVSYYREHEAEILLHIADVTERIALPFRIAELRRMEPVTALPVPVYGVAVDDVADTWGAARSEGRTHEGVDIFAERGTPVFSATDGYVVRRNIGTRGGINVMVVGPAGHLYYYAHLDRIAEGIRVGTPITVDTTLGFVGDTGNASGTPPHLHFGIYPRRFEAINPYPLLVERE